MGRVVGNVGIKYEDDEVYLLYGCLYGTLTVSQRGKGCATLE
jgi:hypothetical protein